MLNIYKLKLKSNLLAILASKGKDIGNFVSKARHYPPATKEWFNSIYAFNKNTHKSLSVCDKVIFKIIRNYFNMYSLKLERKIKSPRIRRWKRRFSTRRILVSRAELKHTSDKVIVTLYIYDRQKLYFLKKIKKIAKSTLGLLKFKGYRSKVRIIRIKAAQVVLKVRELQKLYLKTLSSESELQILKLRRWKYSFIYFIKYLRKYLRKEMLHMYLKQIISFNKLKFKDTYLLRLKKLIEKVYNKRVEFNLVNIKYIHLNSDIFTGILITKLRNRNNRLWRVLNLSLRKAIIQPLDRIAIYDEMYNKKKINQNLKLNDFISDPFFFKSKIKKDNALKKSLVKLFKSNVSLEDTISNDLETEKSVFNSIKHKHINGIRIEASGRLSRRFTAARSVFKVKYLGSIKNMDSSYKGLPSVILRGHVRSNIQFTKLKSKRKIGSFGLKGWISNI